MPLKETAGDRVQLGAILLAAGGSSRLGQSKQLVEIDAEPLVVRQAKLLLDLKPATVVVVCGAEGQTIESALAVVPVRVIHNPDWRRGMGHSLACAIRAMPERVRAALVLLCDQWRLTPGDIASLIDAWTPDPNAAIAAAYEDTLGVPAILPRAMFERLSRLEGEVGARKILRRWKGAVRTVPMPNASVDIDSPSDLERFPDDV